MSAESGEAGAEYREVGAESGGACAYCECVGVILIKFTRKMSSHYQSDFHAEMVLSLKMDYDLDRVHSMIAR